MNPSPVHQFRIIYNISETKHQAVKHLINIFICQGCHLSMTQALSHCQPYYMLHYVTGIYLYSFSMKNYRMHKNVTLIYDGRWYLYAKLRTIKMNKNNVKVYLKRTFLPRVFILKLETIPENARYFSISIAFRYSYHLIFRVCHFERRTNPALK